MPTGAVSLPLTLQHPLSSFHFKCRHWSCFDEHTELLLINWSYVRVSVAPLRWSDAVSSSGGGLSRPLHWDLLRCLPRVGTRVAGRGRLPAQSQGHSSALLQHPLLLSDAALPILLLLRGSREPQRPGEWFGQWVTNTRHSSQVLSYSSNQLFGDFILHDGHLLQCPTLFSLSLRCSF